jgi:ribosomal protein L11 methylase PrmA
VRGVAGTRDWNLAWEVGCNVGVFSHIIAERARHVVAMDFDHQAIDRLYQAIKTERLTNILPLIVNVTDPSPNLGWRNMEHYADYNEDAFERELAARFRIVKRQPLGSGTRIMYHAL